MRRLLGLIRERVDSVLRFRSAGVAGRAPVARIAAASTAVILASTSAVLITTTGGDPPRITVGAVPTTGVPTVRVTRSPTTTPTPPLTPSPEATASGGGGDGAIALTNADPGTGRWQYAGAGPTFGTRGGVLTYRVAVEEGLPVSVGEFTALVDSTLGDPRGWTGRGERRFQRVGASSGASFTVYLASPWTAYSLCRSVVDIRIGGVPYTNCQAGGPVVINSDRYLNGASRFTGGLDVYRRYAVNHEVGHRLGRQHVSCPGSGQLAPVMQQQTLGLQGCRPNAWPYPGNPAPPPPTAAPATTPPETTPPPTTAAPPTTTAPPTATGTATPTTSIPTESATTGQPDL